MFQDYMMYGIVPNIKKCEENQNSFRSDRSSEDRNASDVRDVVGGDLFIIKKIKKLL